MYVGCRSAIAILQIEQLDACICAFLCIWIVEGACTYMYVYARCRLCRGGEGGVGDFRMPGLVGGTVVPGFPLWLLEARLHVHLGGLTARVYTPGS